MRLGYLHRTHRRRKVAPRRHPVPDLIQIVLQVGLKCPDRYFVHARRALVRLDLLPCLLDSPLRNLERFTRRLRSTPITGASPLLRAGPPAGPATVLTPAPGLLPLAHPQKPNAQCRLRPSPVSCRSRRPGSRRLHAGHRLASQRAPARLIPGSWVHPGFGVTCVVFDTSTAIRSRSPSRSPPDTSRVPFPHRSPRSRHRSRSMWRFEASPRRATPKGQQSLISCTTPLQQALPTSNSPPRSGHTPTTTSAMARPPCSPHWTC